MEGVFQAARMARASLPGGSEEEQGCGSNTGRHEQQEVRPSEQWTGWRTRTHGPSMQLE